MILLDSDHVSVLVETRSEKHLRLAARLAAATEAIALPIIVAEEQLRGWLAAIHRQRSPHKQVVPYLRLAKLLLFLGKTPLVDWNESIADRFLSLRRQGIRIGTQDLKIASLALVNNALLLSANLVDFFKVPGLRVEDWLYSADGNGRS